MARSTAFIGRERQLGDLMEHWRAAEQGTGRSWWSAARPASARPASSSIWCPRSARPPRSPGAPAPVRTPHRCGPGTPSCATWAAGLRPARRRPPAAGATSSTPPATGCVSTPAWRTSCAAAATGRCWSCSTTCTGPTPTRWAPAAGGRGGSAVPPPAGRGPCGRRTRWRPTCTPAVRAGLLHGVVHLDGLPADAVSRLVDDLIGTGATAELASEVARLTGGNPFFVRELMRLLVAEDRLDAALAGRPLHVPPLLRDVLLRRVAQVSSSTRSVLDAAAVAGRRVSLAVLEQVAGAAAPPGRPTRPRPPAWSRWRTGRCASPTTSSASRSWPTSGPAPAGACTWRWPTPSAPPAVPPPRRVSRRAPARRPARGRPGRGRVRRPGGRARRAGPARSRRRRPPRRAWPRGPRHPPAPAAATSPAGPRRRPDGGR